MNTTPAARKALLQEASDILRNLWSDTDVSREQSWEDLTGLREELDELIEDLRR